VPKNPFETFGLTPELVAELSDRELFSVLKSMYRSLQKTFHPDMANRRKAKEKADHKAGAQARGADRAVELNLAFEALNLDKDPASFKRLRQVYSARRPASAYQNSLLLKKQLKDQLEREDRLAQSFLSYLALSAFNGKAHSQGQDRLTAPLTTKNVSLGLSDVAITNNIRQSSWFMGSNYKNINVDTNGQVSVKRVGRGKFAQANFIHFLGSVPIEDIELTPLLERGHSNSFKRPALPIGELASAKASVYNVISPENFKLHILPIIKPLLMERSYLFSLNNDTYTNSGLITLEGVIVKLEIL
jgi:hypothetical protein